ncbi:MAG: hypothetical protein ACLRSW_17775 [Christensenellaceae bacterium]
MLTVADILVLGEGQGFGRGKAFPHAKVFVRPCLTYPRRVRGSCRRGQAFPNSNPAA